MAVFRVLGAIEAEIDGRLIDLGHARQKYVLAALLMDANNTVSADELASRVWDQPAPLRVVGTLQSYLTRLRRSLGDQASIVRRTSGYSLVLEDRLSVDAHQFAHLVEQARAEQDPELYARALGLWRGEPLAGLDSEWAVATREWLAGQRLAAELDHTDLRLRLGQHSELVPELRRRSGEHPLDERAAGQLMLALYRAGQQAEALAYYWKVRTTLANELGIDPGSALQKLHQGILSADADLAAPEPQRRGPLPTVPRQLPAVTAGFSGRRAELAALAEMLTNSADGVRTVVITGSGGIGKTALALRWAHLHSADYPDGQLYVNLRGFDPGSPPMSSMTAVRGFLTGLGVPESAVPADLEAQSALFRSVVARRRMLIVLDNAADSAQVTPLLPGGAGCAVLVTSRDRLTGLVNLQGARPLALDVLDGDAARALLATRIGADRLALAQGVVGELLAYCGGFPLALSIVAGRALTRPGLPLVALSAELGDAATRLGVLDEDDPGSGITAVLSCSYDALSGEQARLFVLLGLMPGPDVSQAAAAALAGVPVARVGVVLRGLERLSLVQQELPGRWRMHDVVRLYAVHRAGAELTEEQREAALRRLVSFYARSAQGADATLGNLSVQEIEIEPLVDGVHPERVDPAGAMAWFDAERLCLLAAQQLAADRGWYRSAFEIGWWMVTFHYRRALYQDFLATWRTGAAVAEHLEIGLRSIAHRMLGRAYSRLRRFDETFEHLELSLDLARRSGDVANESRGRYVLGLVHGGRLHDHEAALSHYTEALRLAEQVGELVWQAEAHNDIAVSLASFERFDEARAHSEAAVRLLSAAGSDEPEGDFLDNMGLIAHQSGDYERAVDFYQQSIAAYRQYDNLNSVAAASERLASAYRALGQHVEAREALWQALELFQSQQRDLDVERVLVQINEISASV